MNEQACAFVCSILIAVCLILSCYALHTNDRQILMVVTVLAGIIAVLSGFVLVCKYL